MIRLGAELDETAAMRPLARMRVVMRSFYGRWSSRRCAAGRHGRLRRIRAANQAECDDCIARHRHERIAMNHDLDSFSCVRVVTA